MIRMKALEGSRLLKRKYPETDLEAFKDQDQSNVRIKADSGRVSESDLGTKKDPG
jgi:hypothetical protein